MHVWTKRSLALLNALLGAAFLPALSASACSVTADYIRPTNFELVQIADAIVVATALQEIKSASVEFRVDKIMKGETPKRFVDQRAVIGAVLPGDPNDLSGSHPEGHAGPCNRMTFGKGKQYVIFLSKRAAGEYDQISIPFSRVNEDYLGEDSVWVRTIRTYLDIQKKYAPMEQLDVLEALLDQKLKGPQTPAALAEARDILDHLRSRSPWKPTAYLMRTYKALERGEVPTHGVRSRAADRENSVAQDVTDALFGTMPPPDKMSVEDEKNVVLRSLVLGHHPDAAPLFERLIGVPRPLPRPLGLAVRFFAKNNQYRRAYTLIETQIVRVLAAVPENDAMQLIADVTDAQRGDSYEEGKERWRSDPYVKIAWPELALHLYWFQYHVFGSERMLGSSDAIGTIAIADYRARPLVTLALAGSYDQNVEKWAITEALDEVKRMAWEKKDHVVGEEDPAWLPLQALVRAYGDERDAALRKVACQSEPRRALLIEALGQWGDSLDDSWFAQIAAMPKVSDEERMLIGQALARLYARETAHRGGGLFGMIAGNSEYDLLEKIIGRKEIVRMDKKVEPLRCAK